VRVARPSRRSRTSSSSTGPAVQAYEDLCDELGEQPADVGLAWLLHQPAVTAPIIGPRTLEQLQGTLRAPEIVLDEDTLEAGRDLPGSGRPGTGGLRLVGRRVQRAEQVLHRAPLLERVPHRGRRARRTRCGGRRGCA
jgi:hypothetical protein